MQWNKNYKIIQVNLAKETQDFYTEKYKALLKDIKELNNGKLSHVHDEHTNIVKMIILHRAVYTFNETPTKCQQHIAEM